MEEGGADAGHVLRLPRRAEVQTVAAQLYRLFGCQHAGSFHVTVRHATLMNRSERANQGFGYLAAFLRREGLTLQHVGQTLLNVLHDRINYLGVVEPVLPDLCDGDQVGLLQVLRRLQAGDDLVYIGEGFGKADGGRGALRLTRLGLKPCAAAFGSHQAAQGITPIDCLTFQLIPELHSVLVCRKAECEGSLQMESARQSRLSPSKCAFILNNRAHLRQPRPNAGLPPHVLRD